MEPWEALDVGVRTPEGPRGVGGTGGGGTAEAGTVGEVEEDGEVPMPIGAGWRPLLSRGHGSEGREGGWYGMDG